MNQCMKGTIYLNNKTEIFVSTISDNPQDIFKNLNLYERMGVSGIHFDIMDGSFVPRFGLYPELMREIRKETTLPIEAHLMIDNSEKYLSQILDAGANRIIVHYETLQHPHRTISLIKQMGIEAGIALNPGTNLYGLDYILSDLDLILIMAINPGIPKHPFIIQSLEKITELSKKLHQVNSKIKIEVDGGVTFENAKSISISGADILVCGSGTFFAEGNSTENNIKHLQEKLNT